jgi:protein-tyrosine phosphatase
METENKQGHLRAISVAGLHNARDLGGLIRAGGGLTPVGIFFRSENLRAVTPEGWQQLHAVGIRTVIDLRQPVERHQVSYNAAERFTIVHVDHDGLDDHPDFWGDYWETGLVGTPLYYLPHLKRLPHRSAAVLSAIARAPEGGVLFHCAAGRDRTGIIAMLLLTVAAVAPGAIVDDYLESVRNGAALAAAAGRPNSEPACEELCRKHGTTTEGAFRDVVADLDLDPVIGLLSDEDRKAITTWRGSLA